MLNQLIRGVFALFGLFFMTEGLVFLFTPDKASSAPMVQLMGIGIGGGAILDLLMRPGLMRLRIGTYMPIILIVIYAIFSNLWSVDAELGMRRTGALVLTVIFGIWLAETFNGRTLFNLVILSFMALCVACYVAIFAFPNFGMHQSTNILSDAYVGAWRGMYQHKNDMGRNIALCVIVFTIAALFRPRRRLIYGLFIIAGLGLVAGSRSSQAIVLTIIGSGVAVLAVFLRQRTSAERAMALLFMVPFCVVVYGISDYIVSEVLDALGKDATLSDRTEIWSVVLTAMGDNIFFGGGYGAGWKLVSDEVLQRFGRPFGHAHNGYIQLAVNVGVVGAVLFFTSMAYLTILSFFEFMQARSHEWACFWMAYAAFFFVGNMAASFSLEYNNINTVFFVLALKLLRPTFSRASERTRVSAGNKPI